jgi:antitoxin PrlF
MKVTTKGQVTIPARIREYLGVTPHGEVDFRISNGEVVLVKKDDSSAQKSRFAALRGVLKGGLTTDQWVKATRC